MNALLKEYMGAQLGDPRRHRRLLDMVELLAVDPTQSFPQALEDGAALEGAYRLMSNEHVDADALVAPHIAQTLARMDEHEVTLLLHDTSTMSFGADGSRQGLSTNAAGRRQHFDAHVTLAATSEGLRRPLGVAAMSRHVVAKGRQSAGKEDPAFVPGQHQERWGAHVDALVELGVAPSRVVHVMDREADDYSLMAQLCGQRGRFVIRKQHNRKLADGSRMAERLQQAPKAAVMRTVQLGHREPSTPGSKKAKTHPPHKARKAKLALSAQTLCIKRPETVSKTQPETLTLNLVRVDELDPPSADEAVQWLLWTREPVDTPEQIGQVVDWYRDRWLIEEFFKALKTGCRYEARQLCSLHALSNALSLFVPIAYRILLLRSVARQSPEQPAELVLEATEITVLRSVGKRKLPPNPTVHDALYALAGLGGHLKRNGSPGWLTLARGYKKLVTLVQGWKLAKSNPKLL